MASPAGGLGASHDYDVVIAGGGTAGCLLAGRLSADPARRVLLIEAGGWDWNPLLRVPLMSGMLLRGRYATWPYVAEPEENLGGRALPWPRGRVVGGTSSINGMIHVRGLPSDYDRWARDDLPDWSYDRLLELFKRSETASSGRDSDRGRTGPLPVTRPPNDNPLFDSFAAAAQQAGLPHSDDLNGATPDGVGRYDMAVASGQRWSAARAFLHPARRRANLDVLTRSLAVRLLFEGCTVRGLEFLRRGRLERVDAGMVILSCGAVETPCVLMRSGVADPAQSRRLGIPVVVPQPDVGRNLQDHLIVRVQHRCTQPVTLHSLLRWDRAAFAIVQALLTSSGPASVFPLQVGAYYRSDPGLREPDLQSTFVPGLSTAALRLPWANASEEGFFANVHQMRPESRGEIVLRSADPLTQPVIRANYCSAPRDREVLRAGVRRLREILAQPALAWCRGAEISPGPAVVSDKDLDTWMAATATTAYHSVGTCRMGGGGRGVVDSELRVRGVNGVMVADASIMPTITSANTNAPTMMIAERAADLVVGTAQS